jgi:hypothetical protein
MLTQDGAASPTALELMNLQVRTLFRLDQTGRLIAINEAANQPAPRLFLGRTPAGNLWRVRYDLSDSLVDELEAILIEEPVVTDLHQPPVSFQCLINALRRHTPVERVWQGPAWYFPDAIVPPNDIATVAVSDLDLLSATFGGTVESWVDSHPCMAVVEQETLAAVCFSARTSAAASEAGVETLAAFRGRGFASAATVAWANAIRELGRIPLYSTSWDNLASQGVARRLGLQLYGADLHFT